MIRENHVQIQPTPSPLHCDLEHIRIPTTKLCVCARARACVCDIYFKSCISQVKLYKTHGRYYVERGSAFYSSSSSSFFFFFFFFVFLDYVKYKYYRQQQFLKQKNKKNKGKKEELKQ